MLNENLRISKQAKVLMENLKEFDLDKFREWFFTESKQTVVGSATFTEYFLHLKAYGDKSDNN